MPKLKLDSWWIGLIVFALLLRIFFAAFFFHTDLKGHYMEAALTQNGIAKGYDQGVKQNTPLHYPPVIYILYNTHRFVNGWMFSPNFRNWLNDTSFLHLENNNQIFRDLLVMKLPILLFDFLTAWLLILLAPAGKKRLAASLWLLNPFSLYAIYFFGQFDIIAAFMVLLTIFLWQKDKKTLGYAVLGLAAAVKVFPLLLLPVLLIYDNRALSKKILGICVFALAFLICLIPILTSVTALKSVFLSNLAGSLFKTTLDLGGEMKLPLYLTLYLFTIAGLFLNYLKKPAIGSLIFILLTMLLVLSSFHPQWMVWLMPLMVLLLVNKTIGWIEASVFLLSYLAVSLLINDKFVALGTLKAINQSFDSVPSLRFLVDKIGFGTQLQGIFNAVLFVCAIVFSLQIFERFNVFKSVSLKSINLKLLTPLWIIALLVFIVSAHIPLVYFGKLVDSSHLHEQSRLLLAENTTVSQKITIKNPNFNSLEIRFKNIGLKNHNNIGISLAEENGPAIYNQTINGGSIGDDYNLLLKFPSQKGSAGKTYILTISQPEPVKEEEVMVLPYDGETYDSEIMVNDQLINGSLSYTAFYNTGSLMDNLKYSTNSVLSKI